MFDGREWNLRGNSTLQVIDNIRLTGGMQSLGKGRKSVIQDLAT